MAKTSFPIRVDMSIADRFRAISTILNVGQGQLFTEMIEEKEKTLTEDQKMAQKVFLKARKKK